jgi:hypothetical protein
LQCRNVLNCFVVTFDIFFGKFWQSEIWSWNSPKNFFLKDSRCSRNAKWNEEDILPTIAINVQSLNWSLIQNICRNALICRESECMYSGLLE